MEIEQRILEIALKSVTTDGKINDDLLPGYDFVDEDFDKSLVTVAGEEVVEVKLKTQTTVFDGTNFNGLGTTLSPLTIETNVIANYLKSLPGWTNDGTKSLRGDLTWVLDATGGGNGGGGGNAYLTWAITGADMEGYNVSKGMRKKSSGSAGWDTPTLAASSSLSTQNLSNGQSVVIKISSNPALATSLILSTSTAPHVGATPPTNVNFALYTGANLTSVVQPMENNANYGSTTAIIAGDYLRMSYGSKILYEKSSDGITWSTIATSVGTPTGTYYIVVQSYSPLGGFDEIYKP